MHRKSFSILCSIFLVVFTLVAISPSITAQSSTLYINEILVGNATKTLDTDYYNYSQWIEIYNASASSINLQGYSLSYLDYEATTPRIWKIPAGVVVPANGHILLWADEMNNANHANFDMDMRGDTIQLLSPSNAVLDSVSYDMRIGSVLLPDISYGRQTDGHSEWAYFDQPTAAASQRYSGLCNTCRDPCRRRRSGGSLLG